MVQPKADTASTASIESFNGRQIVCGRGGCGNNEALQVTGVGPGCLKKQFLHSFLSPCFPMFPRVQCSGPQPNIHEVAMSESEDGLSPKQIGGTIPLFFYDLVGHIVPGTALIFGLWIYFRPSFFTLADGSSNSFSQRLHLRLRRCDHCALFCRRTFLRWNPVSSVVSSV